MVVLLQKIAMIFMRFWFSVDRKQANGQKLETSSHGFLELTS